MKPLPTAFLLFALGCEEEQPAPQINYDHVLAGVPEPPTPEQVYQSNLEKAVAVATKAVEETKVGNPIYPDRLEDTKRVENNVFIHYTYSPLHGDSPEQFTIDVTVTRDPYLFSFHAPQDPLSKETLPRPESLVVKMKKKGSSDGEAEVTKTYSFAGLEKMVQNNFDDVRTYLLGTPYKSLNYDAGCIPDAKRVTLSESYSCTFADTDGMCTSYACVTDVPLTPAGIGLIGLEQQTNLLKLRAKMAMVDKNKSSYSNNSTFPSK